MKNVISSIMVALVGFFGGANRYRRNLDEGLAEHANDLLFAQGLLALILLFAGGVKLVLPLGVLRRTDGAHTGAGYAGAVHRGNGDTRCGISRTAPTDSACLIGVMVFLLERRPGRG